jgi:flavorubredoxin
MRIFDIVMRTEYGTSYNSYIVKGSNKIALIDGCHETFTDAYIKNIEEIVPLKNINYLVVNHCEPDHTGAFRKILKLIPQVQIYCTAASKIFLSEITQLPLNIHVVQNNELLDLGDKTLQFIIAPFLH